MTPDTKIDTRINLTANGYGTHNSNIAKFVSYSHGFIVQQAGGGNPARICVIGKDDELVFIALVANPEQTFLDV